MCRSRWPPLTWTSRRQHSREPASSTGATIPGAIIDPGAHGPDQDWTKLFFSPVPGKRATNVHVRIEGQLLVQKEFLRPDELRRVHHAPDTLPGLQQQSR
jgi:hypothetical protein